MAGIDMAKQQYEAQSKSKMGKERQLRLDWTQPPRPQADRDHTAVTNYNVLSPVLVH